VVASVYALALCFNAWQEAFGPSGAGMRPAEPGLTVARVAGGSPFDRQGCGSAM
jgi:hypothetical protein